MFRRIIAVLAVAFGLGVSSLASASPASAAPPPAPLQVQISIAQRFCTQSVTTIEGQFTEIYSECKAQLGPVEVLLTVDNIDYVDPASPDEKLCRNFLNGKLLPGALGSLCLADRFHPKR